MHLLASYKIGALRALPSLLPPGLYEAAARRTPPRSQFGPASPPSRTGDASTFSGISRQFSGPGAQLSQSPITGRPTFHTPPQSAQTTGGDWLISPRDKSQFDGVFAGLDKAGRGFITGDEAVRFFGNSRLPEEILAQIWDLADINSEGHLNRDEFAVAMYLIRQQRGTQDGRGSLPNTLPPALIPPSMRQQVRPPAQPTAPAFDNETYATSKSASEDLFGLDAFASPSVTQPPAKTDGSSALAKAPESDAFPSAKSSSPTVSHGPLPASTPQSSSVFKPFVPSSSFGQNIMTSQATGGSNSSGPSSQPLQQSQHSAADDLLGDNDPEVSKKLTAETTELANLSNQVGTLSTQMQEVKTKKTAAEQDLSGVGSQKREFESRLSQLRSLYEREVQEVKALEDRLASSRAETKKLQQDIAMIEGTYQDLQTQHQHAAAALVADQQENANLKERMRVVNAETAQLRPQLEKLRSDARQQKGLVAINKKQLATNEAERERVRGEIDETLQTVASTAEPVRSFSSTSQVQSPAPVASPAPSTTSQSTNPFFRRPTGGAGENSATSGSMPSAPVTAASLENHNSFETVFGPTHPAQPPSDISTTPNRQAFESQPRSLSSTSPGSGSVRDSPAPGEPRPPPESRQITSDFLPLRSDLSRADSLTSSVKVSAPASRYGENDTSGADTPTNWSNFVTDTPRQELDESSGGLQRAGLARTDTEGTEVGRPSAEAGLADSVSTNGHHKGDAKMDEQWEIVQGHEQSSTSSEMVPGAFPADSNSPIQTPTEEDPSTHSATVVDRSADSVEGRPPQTAPTTTAEPFAQVNNQPRTATTSKDDFDAAFAGFGSSTPLQERQNEIKGPGDASTAAGSSGLGTRGREFPPIEEFGNDEESESASEQGFDDDFTSPSPHPGTGATGSTNGPTGQAKAVATNDQLHSSTLAVRPDLNQRESSVQGQPPTPGAQKSPPSYGQTVGATTAEGHHPGETNHFPAEFTGLLPSREDPTSPRESPEKAVKAPMTADQALFGGPNAPRGVQPSVSTGFSPSPPVSDTPDVYHSASSQPSGGPGPSQATGQASHPSKMAVDDDFDRDFADLADAREADDGKGEVDFGAASHHPEGLDEFNPVFDSPAPSKSNTIASQHTSMTTNPSHGVEGFNDFEHNLGGPTQASSRLEGSQQSLSATSHDWDAIFAGLDGPLSSQSKGAHQSGFETSNAGVGSSHGEGSSATTSKPPLGRALTSGTEHDDPILKKLTGMGYPRDLALGALEQYDYNIDKVRRLCRPMTLRQSRLTSLRRPII